MPITLNITKEQRGCSLILDCTVNCHRDYNDEIKSKAFKIDNLGVVQLNFRYNKDVNQFLSVYSMQAKLSSCDVKMTVDCSELGYTAQWACTNKWSQFEEIGELQRASYYCDKANTFLMKLRITIFKEEPKLDVYNKFYNDDELVDFKLCTADGSGSVGVHRLILSASSEVFKTMFHGECKETISGQINIAGVTVYTLKYLKDYLYMGVLPEIGLRPLLLIAMRYLIIKLKKQCIQKIVQTVTSRNLYTVLEFACENNIPELSFALLCTTPSSTVHAVYQSRKNKKSLETDW